jgi:hypothetical protein
MLASRQDKVLGAGVQVHERRSGGPQHDLWLTFSLGEATASRGSTNGGGQWIVSNHGTAKLPALSPYIAHS